MQYPGNDVASQRLRILHWFSLHSSLTTDQARRELDVYHPAGRIQELRAEGWQIVTLSESVPTASGRLRRIGKYLCTAGQQ